MAIIKRKYRTKKQQKPIVYYQAEVFIKGVHVAVKNFSIRREAILWHKKEKQKFVFSPTSLNDKMLFKDCMDKFWEDAKTRIMKSTFQSYECRLSYFYSSPLADVKMSELKSIKVVEWISWLKKHRTAKNKGRKTFQHELKFLSVVLNWYRNFINEDFNVPITKKHRQMSIYKKATPRRPDYFMEPEDARRWVEWLKKHRNNPVYWRLASFMLLTGARVGEACGLKWDALI